MSDASMGDEVYQPRQDDEQDARSGPDLENALDEPDLDRTLDEGYSPPERPYAADEGVTAREQRAGASLDERIAEEVPDVAPPPGDGIGDRTEDGEPLDDQVGDARAGRVVGSDEGVPRRGDDVTGTDVGVDGGAASAEEAAVHVVEDERRGGTGDDGAGEPATGT